MGIVERLVPDELWELFQRVVPEAPSRPQGGGRRRHGDREVLAAIVFVATSGCTWQQLPTTSSGLSGATAHRRFSEWSNARVWAKLHADKGYDYTHLRSRRSSTRWMAAFPGASVPAQDPLTFVGNVLDDQRGQAREDRLHKLIDISHKCQRPVTTLRHHRMSQRRPAFASALSTYRAAIHGRRLLVERHRLPDALDGALAPTVAPCHQPGAVRLGSRTAPFSHRASSCHCWLVPVPTGHWMTRAPSAADPLSTSAHQPLRTLTSR